VGCVDGWSDKFTFQAMTAGVDWSPSFAVYGDMGNVNGASISRLQQEAQAGHFDAILHVGTILSSFLDFLYINKMTKSAQRNYVQKLREQFEES